MSPKRRILIVAQRPSDFTEMIRAGRELHRRGHSVHALYHYLTSDRRYDQPVLKEIEQCRLKDEINDVTCIDLNVLLKGRRSTRAKPAKPNRPARFPLLGKTLDATTRLIQDLNSPYFYVLYRKLFRYYDALVRSLDVDVIILPEDVVGMVTPLVIKAGHRNGTPSLILPYTIANQREAFTSLASNESCQTRNSMNRLTAILFPKWRMRESGTDLIRLPTRHVVAHELLRVSPPDPWMMNSGYANVIGVENEAMRDYYRAAGIPETKVRVVGAVYDDTLAAFREAKECELSKVRSELRIQNDKPLLLIGGCPNQLAGPVPSCDFASMTEIAAFLVAALAPLRGSFEIVVRPHPNYPEFGDMLAALGFHQTTIDTARMIAVSDLYLAFASATIRWAIGCGVPTVNYDVFGYDYSDFKGIGGVFSVRTRTQLNETLGRLQRDGQGYADAHAAIQRERARWSMTDGHSGDRIEALVEELASLEVVPRTTS